MKRIWFAIIFISICLSLCVGEQVYIKNVHNELNKRIAAAEAAPNADNIAAIKNYYKGEGKLLTTIYNAEDLIELNKAIDCLDNEDYDISASLTEVKSISDRIYESQIISPSNIF